MEFSGRTAADADSRRQAQTAAGITSIVLTFDSDRSIGKVIRALKAVSSRILVVDSGSRDSTRAISESMGCEFVEHPFENYSLQRRWAQAYAGLASEEWVLHVDSDEVLSPELAMQISQAVSLAGPEDSGFLVRRLSYFWGKPIRYGHMNPSWHLRLFRAGRGRCEDRMYDQHFICEGKTTKLSGVLHDLQMIDLERWTASHNRWSTAEAREALGTTNQDHPSRDTLPASLGGDIRSRKRWVKERIWYRLPPLVRPFLFFFYSYVLRLGFLDGRVGVVFHVLQAFWFRFLVDAKVLELRMGHATQDNPAERS